MTAGIDDLRDILKNGKALIVCGAGVSAALSDGRAPGWGKLIQNAREFAKPKSGGNADWYNVTGVQLSMLSPEQWLLAADQIKKELERQKRYEAFFREQLASLMTVDDKLMESLRCCHGVGNKIATTNYDDLLRKGLNVDAVPWTKPDEAALVLSTDRDDVLHLHGTWHDINSVVFSNEDYNLIRQNDKAQFLQQLATHTRTLVFMGCSKDGLADENIGALLEWFQSHWSGLGKSHYVLCLDKDGAGWPDAVTPIVYGTSHGDLTAFLGELAPAPAIAEARLEVDPRMIGRGDVKQQILAWVGADNRPVIISGGPGMGKSAMALAVAYDPLMKAQFGEERYFLRLDAAGDAHALATSAAAKLGVRVQNARAEVIADQIAGAIVRPTLLILDNLESPWDKNRAEVENVIARFAACAPLQMLLTIRGATPNLPCAAHETGDIQELNEADSLALFHRATRDRFVGDADVPALMLVMAGHPLCITLMAAQADGVGVRDVLAQWERQRAKMVKKDGADHRLNNLEISVGLSFERLSGVGKRLARLMARLPAGFAVAMAREILSSDADEAALELVRARVAKLTDWRLSMLAPVREAMLLQAVQANGEENSLLRRFLGIAAKGNRALQDFSDGEVFEIENLDAALLWAIEEAIPENLVEAQFGLATLHRFTSLGSVSAVTRGIEFWHKRSATGKEAQCIKSLGDIAFARSDLDTALAKFEEALQLYRKAGLVLGEGNCIKGIGNIALRRSDFNRAREKYEEVLPLFRRERNVLGEANCILSLGEIALGCFDHDGARAKIDEALPLFRKADNVQGQANCMFIFGKIAFARFDHDEARTKFEEAIPLYRNVGDMLGEANCFLQLGDNVKREQSVEAASLWSNALLIYGRIPEPESMGQAHRRLAHATTGTDHAHHLAEARRLWLSIGRADLVAEFLDGA